MSNTNIVEFGMEDARFATTTVDPGTLVPTFGTLIQVPGSVDLAMEISTSEQPFHADNRRYYVVSQISNQTCNLEMAKFPDAFKKEFLGYEETTDGGLARIDNAKKKNLSFVFVGDGDAHKVKRVLYNCAPGFIERGYHTNEEGVEVETETLPLTVLGLQVGDKQVALVEYPASSAGYASLATAISAPAFPAEP